MSSPVRADVVNALINPVIEVLRSLGGLEPQVENLSVEQSLPPAPCFSVTIDLRGEVQGPITWVFNDQLSRVLTRHMLGEASEADSQTRQDVVAEVANMVAGHATGCLLDAGYKVDIEPPAVDVRMAGDAELVERKLQVKLTTDAGHLRMVLDIRVHKA